MQTKVHTKAHTKADEGKVTISDTQYQALIQENSSLKEENEKLYSLNDSMQKEIERYNDLRRLSINYIGYEQQYRYIESGKEIYWIPSDTLNKMTSTYGNTLAEVIFAGFTKVDEIWLFVTIPTFDTPSNNMGGFGNLTHKSIQNRYLKILK